MTLPEDSSPRQIVDWFREHGWELKLHMESPPRGDVSNVPRALRVLQRFNHWADLVSVETGDVVSRWYGGGMDEAQALKSAMRRWRTEQGESS
jgi:hypothetical protein